MVKTQWGVVLSTNTIYMSSLKMHRSISGVNDSAVKNLHVFNRSSFRGFVFKKAEK